MEGKTDNMTNMTPTELATIVMAIVIALQLIILFFQFLLFHKQTQANRLSALREIFFYHHSEEMRNLREEVSAKLLVMLASNQTHSMLVGKRECSYDTKQKFYSTTMSSSVHCCGII